MSFNGANLTSGTLTFVGTTPHQLLQIDAANGGSTATTLTFSCAGQPTRQATLLANQAATITTNWSGACTTVTVSSSNGWYTNLDNIVIN
jgi:hypothetical protein